MKSPQNNIRLRLKERERSYTIAIRSGVFSDIPKIVAREFPRASIFIITDTNVRRLYGETLLQKFVDQGYDACLLDFPAGEQSKNIKIVSALHTALLRNNVRRNSVIVALGGGVVGDAAGFVAATILRGVTFVQIPTTLLAQVDSSLGGKVGIDHRLGKNLIGAFHQPAAVYIDPIALQTLAGAEFRNGLAEVVKIAAALDGKFFAYLERNAARISKDNSRLLAEIVRRSVGLKAAVVEKDEYESGLRKALNLGHTIGHAIEAAMDFSIKHGEAVSIGMVAEARLAERIGLLNERDYGRLLSLLRSLKLPTAIPPRFNKRRFIASLSLDKKSSGGVPKFVLLNRIGSCAIGVEVPAHDIERIVKD